MNNKRYGWREFSALSLLIVMTFAVLVKPLHVFIIDHSCLYNSVSDHLHDEFNNFKDTDCPICDFEFCQIIPQSDTEVPTAVSFPYHQFVVHEVDCFVENSAYYFDLRAPPAV